MLAELWYDQLCTGPIRHHPLHDTINISQRLRAGGGAFSGTALGAQLSNLGSLEISSSILSRGSTSADSRDNRHWVSKRQISLKVATMLRGGWETLIPLFALVIGATVLFRSFAKGAAHPWEAGASRGTELRAGTARNLLDAPLKITLTSAKSQADDN